ncbi:MAG: hypothetical protein R6U51_00560 [Anaerolineales bacterium]
MKKTLQTLVSDRELMELLRIFMNEDSEAALSFLKEHFKGEAKRLLEGG